MSAWEPDWFEGAVASAQMLAWRGVEAQHVVSTMRLVDTPQEQDLLEQLLEASKPPLPAAARRQHYLLTTPFRYRPMHPSRFRPARTPGQWYGAESLHAACAEVAWWRRQFIVDSEGLRGQVLLTEHSFFQARLSGPCLDLTAEPWARSRATWTHPSDYSATHAIAAEAQARGAQWLRYESARAPGEACAAAFTPACLREPAGGLDRSMQTWRCKATQHSVWFTGSAGSYYWEFAAPTAPERAP